MLKKAVLLLVMFLPNKMKIIVLRNLLKADIGKGVYIGLSFIDSNKISIGDYAYLGHLNFVSGLMEFRVGKNSKIGNLNRFTAESNYGGEARFIMHQSASLTSRHYFDCSSSIEIGEFSIISGMATQIFTHGINVEINRQELDAVTIGRNCLIGTRCTILKGAVLPDFCVLGAHSLYNRAFVEEFSLYGGNPASHRRNLNKDGLFFNRSDRVVS